LRELLTKTVANVLVSICIGIISALGFFVGHCYDYDDAIKTAKRLGATKITKDY